MTRIRFFLFQLLIVLVSTGCASSWFSDPCLANRAAIDIGSGSLKMKAARVDICSSRILNILAESQTPLALKDAVTAGKGKLGLAVITDTVAKVEDLKQLANEAGVPFENMRAVATAALRDASDSESLVSTLTERGLKTQIITQSAEAQLGLLSASIVTKTSPAEITVFDIGGGSFQIASLGDKFQMNMTLGNIASVSFKDYIVKMQQRDRERAGKKTKAGETPSPNPISPAHAKKAIEFAERYARSLPKPVLKSSVVGIGGVFASSIQKQLDATEFDAAQLAASYPALIKRTNADIGGPFAATESSNLLLVLGLMRGFGIERIRLAKANLTEGMLINPAYFGN